MHAIGSRTVWGLSAEDGVTVKVYNSQLHGLLPFELLSWPSMPGNVGVKSLQPIAHASGFESCGSFSESMH